MKMKEEFYWKSTFQLQRVTAALTQNICESVLEALAGRSFQLWGRRSETKYSDDHDAAGSEVARLRKTTCASQICLTVWGVKLVALCSIKCGEYNMSRCRWGRRKMPQRTADNLKYELIMAGFLSGTLHSHLPTKNDGSSFQI